MEEVYATAGAKVTMINQRKGVLLAHPDVRFY
jgi:hypothetical protein